MKRRLVCESRRNCRQRSAKYLYPVVFSKPYNPEIHETTGPEIWKTPDGQGGCVYLGVGSTGGTLTGVTRYIKGRRVKPILSPLR